MKKRIALLKGLWFVLTKEWVPGMPSAGQVCMVWRPYMKGKFVSEAAAIALRRELLRRGFVGGRAAWNDKQTSRWPVVRLYLSALVRG